MMQLYSVTDNIMASAMRNFSRIDISRKQSQLAACYRALGIANRLRDGGRHKSRIMARANRLRAELKRVGG